MVNPCHAEFILGNIKIQMHLFIIYQDWDGTDSSNTFLFHGQYQGCWWPGDSRSQGISSNDIDLAVPEYSSWWIMKILPTKIQFFFPFQLFKKPHPSKKLNLRLLEPMPMGTLIQQTPQQQDKMVFFHNVDNLKPTMAPIKGEWHCISVSVICII